MSDKPIVNLRMDYALRSLSELDVNPNPILQFDLWLQDAITAGVHEPHAMNVATVGADGRPSSRFVLLRGYDEHGLVFYTNFESRKGQDIIRNPWAALCFWWGALERQIRIEGPVDEVDSEAADHYFASRPRASQLGAWVSNQSRVIPGRKILDEKLAEVTARYEGQPVPRPPHWGGYLIRPDYMEFWQGRPSRLHDRLAYTRENETWVMSRLSP